MQQPACSWAGRPRARWLQGRTVPPQALPSPPPALPCAQAGWKAEHGFGYPLLSDPDMAVLKQLGCVSAEGKIVRAHFVVAPGGAVEDAQVGVSSKDSVPLALAFVAAK
jgi:peroxiredoxin